MKTTAAAQRRAALISGGTFTLALILFCLSLVMPAGARCFELTGCPVLADSCGFAFEATECPAVSGFLTADGGEDYWWDGFGLPGVAEPELAYGTVYAMTEWNGALAVGGSFYWAGGLPTGMVAFWDGGAWRGIAERIPYG